METTQTLNANKSIGRKVLNILSYYPLFWATGILIYALVKSKILFIGLMLSWVAFVYIGSFAWIGLLIFLNVKKKITVKQTLVQVLILTIGTVIAYYVFEYDVLNSGVKYLD